MAERVILNNTSKEPFAANLHKKQESKHTVIQYRRR